ncbi:MAG TPA: SCO family protein [Opitutus sp.]|nr:SCO family protein [Opitutus sp.]
MKTRFNVPQVGTPLRGVRALLREPSPPHFLWRLLAAVFSAALVAHAQPQTDAPGVRYEQRIGERLPLDVAFTDSSGSPCKLGDFFRGQPVVLFFGYARCPQLCSVITDGTTSMLRRLVPTAGRNYQIVHISIDPTETPRDSRSAEDLAVRRYGRTGAAAGWHYLTGTSQAIAEVTSAAGFHFLYDPRSQLYAHASGFLIATPAGVISRYFLGVDFLADDVAPALKRAGEGKTGLAVFDLLLLCCRGGKIGGRYGRIIWDVLGVSVGLTVAGLFGGIGWMLYQERRGRARPNCHTLYDKPRCHIMYDNGRGRPGENSPR